ncbi:hypothetical protein [Acidithiobacillus sp.]|uniref:hypothetical protein n=1 Tax=Acidithiobacillus sp. TaxID=1872118 RepID=UPI0031FF31B1
MKSWPAALWPEHRAEPYLPGAAYPVPWPGPPAERRGLLTFVMVRGGPTGVELAGDIAELVRHNMENDLHHFHLTSEKELIGQNIGP